MREIETTKQEENPKRTQTVQTMPDVSEYGKMKSIPTRSKINI
jgi:hypothetical protein